MEYIWNQQFLTKEIILGDSQDEPSKSALTVLAICDCSNNVGHQLLYVN